MMISRLSSRRFGLTPKIAKTTFSSSSSSSSSSFFSSLSRRTGLVSSHSPTTLTIFHSQLRSRRYNQRTFRSSARSQAPPLLGLLKLLSMKKVGIARVSGFGYRYMRKRMSESQMKQLQEIKGKYKGKVGIGLSLCIAAYIALHLEKTPITNRLRFIDTNKEEFDLMCVQSLAEIKEANQEKMLPKEHPLHRAVERMIAYLDYMAHKLYSEEMTAAGLQFTTHVIESEEVNAFVMPTGDVFVYTGLLNVMNEDEVAFCLSHELSHAILRHTEENLSFLGVLMWLKSVGAFLISSTFGFGASEFIAQNFSKAMMMLTAELPYSRAMESEADQLGILLSVRSCYAPEGGPSFFVRMEEVEEMTKVWKEEQEAAAEAERKARVEAELEAGRSAPEAAVSPASGSASAFASKPVSTVGEMVGLSLCACTLSSSMSSAAALSPAMNGRVKIKLDPDAEGDVGGEREQQSETRRVSMYDQYMHSRRLHATVQKNADSNSNTIRNSNRGNNDSSSSANPILRKHLTDVTRGSSSASRSIAGADAVNIDAADAADAEDTEDLDEEVQAMIETVEGYLSTHPANLKRYQDTIAWIPAAVELRNSDGTCASINSGVTRNPLIFRELRAVTEEDNRPPMQTQCR